MSDYLALLTEMYDRLSNIASSCRITRDDDYNAQTLYDAINSVDILFNYLSFKIVSLQTGNNVLLMPDDHVSRVEDPILRYLYEELRYLNHEIGIADEPFYKKYLLSFDITMALVTISETTKSLAHWLRYQLLSLQLGD